MKVIDPMKGDGFELVSAANNRMSVRTTEIQIENTPKKEETSESDQAPVPNNIDATLRKLLDNESTVNIPAANSL